MITSKHKLRGEIWRRGRDLKIRSRSLTSWKHNGSVQSVAEVWLRLRGEPKSKLRKVSRSRACSHWLRQHPHPHWVHTSIRYVHGTRLRNAPRRQKGLCRQATAGFAHTVCWATAPQIRRLLPCAVRDSHRCWYNRRGQVTFLNKFRLSGYMTCQLMEAANL